MSLTVNVGKKNLWGGALVIPTTYNERFHTICQMSIAILHHNITNKAIAYFSKAIQNISA